LVQGVRARAELNGPQSRCVCIVFECPFPLKGTESRSASSFDFADVRVLQYECRFPLKGFGFELELGAPSTSVNRARHVRDARGDPGALRISSDGCDS
ncbi:hypothetical protein SAMN04487948_103546, partial [Halogranum amylolyticum]